MIPARMRHPVSADPYQDESLVGYLARLAQLRRFRSVSAFAKAYGFGTFTTSVDGANIAALSEAARVPEATIRSLSFGAHGQPLGEFRGVPLNWRAFVHAARGRRICPLCLAEAPYQRIEWHLVPVVVCPVHSVMLVTKCPTCGDLRWSRSTLTKCRCGLELRLMRTSSVPPDDVRGTKAVLGLLRDPRFTNEGAEAASLVPFLGMEPSQILDFLFRFGIDVLGHRPKRFSMDYPHELACQFHLALNAGLAAAEGWPGIFEAALEEIQGTGPWKLTPSLAQSAGNVRRWAAALPGSVGATIVDTCEDWEIRTRLAYNRNVPWAKKATAHALSKKWIGRYEA